jgi:chromosome segregation ATPase
MTIRVAAATLAAASLMAIAACDSRDYEAEIATLESDLQSARSENEQMQTQLDELRAQAEAQPEAQAGAQGGAMPEGGMENVKNELNNVVQTAATTFKEIGSMTEEPDAPAEQRTEALGGLREGMQKIVQSTQAAAENLGIELETVALDTDADATEGTATQPEPAAGPADQPAQGGAEEPAAGATDQPAPGTQEQKPAPAAQ